MKAPCSLLVVVLAACGGSAPPPVLSADELARAEGAPDTDRNVLDGPFESFEQAPSPHEAQISPLQEGGPAGPFLAVVLLEYIDPQNPTARSCGVAIRTQAGWFRTSLFSCSHQDERSYSMIEALQIDLAAAEAETPEAKVWFRQDIHWRASERGGEEQEHRTYVIACSIVDGTPSCADKDEQPLPAR